MQKSDKGEKYADKPHILIIDDDDRIRSLVSRYLQDYDFVVCTAHDSAHAKEMMQRLVFDALVVDIMMPGQSGLEFTEEIRATGNDIPVLLLTALGEVDDRITGLESGADDYLSKPFEPKELVLRLQAILRRKMPSRSESEDFRIGRWVYHPPLNELYLHDDAAGREGQSVQRLTTVEGNLIKALASRAGEAVSREDLGALCGLEAGERTIDVQVTRLRRKIEEDTKTPRYLQTVRGKGYLLHITEP